MRAIRRDWVRFALILSALGFTSTVGAQSAHQTSEPPSVFLITIDTLRADHLHCYGYNQIQTLALDGLAADGILFTNAFTPAPITNVSHASILTGLQPSSHGVTDFGLPLAPSHATWAELVKPRRYQTAAFIGSIVLDSKTLAPGFNRGFDFYDNFPEKRHAESPEKTPRWNRLERRGMVVVDHAEAWMNAHPGGPKFVWIHLYDPHDPYEPPPPFSTQYKDHLYDGEIAYADSALGNFLDFLKKKGLYDHSLIVVVGDHGEGLGEHNEETHGIFLYDSTTHVPLIIKLPSGTDAGKSIAAQVRTTDLLPTALEILGIPPPASLDGASLRPLLEQPADSERTLLGETDYPLLFGWAPLRSIRAGGIKYIEAPRPELYDLKSDPGELHNIYQPWNDQVKKSREILAQARAAHPPATAAASTAVGTDTVDELKALGYLGRADVGSATTVPGPSLLPDPKDKIEEQNLLHTAMIANEDGRVDAARDAFQKTLQLDPNSIAALQQLGELELQAGDFPQAALHFSRAHELRPADAELEFKLARAFAKQENFTSARDVLLDSLRLAPDQLAARLELGKVYLSLGSNTEALDQFQAAQLLDPSSVDAALGRAAAQIQQGNIAEAVRDLQSLSRSHPRNADVFDTLARALRKSGDNDGAARAEQKAKLLRQAAPVAR
jgi:choline-sulfatase